MKSQIHILLAGVITLTGCSKDQLTPASEKNGLKSGTYAPAGYSLVWEDNFDGPAINTDNWVVASLRDPATGDLVPGAAGDHLLNTSYAGYITQEDTYISNGSLVLRNQKRPYQGTSPAGNYNYTSGWVMSMHRVYLNKGYIEVGARFPSGDKVWPAIWLIAEDLVWGPEWDLFEYFGYRSDVGYDDMGMHLCYGTYPNIKWVTSWITTYDSKYDCEVFHVYGFEWTDTYAKWFINGVQVNSVNKTTKIKWPDENMFIVLNNGQRTASPDATTTWPNTLEIDYIQVYKKNTGNLLTNGGFETGKASPWVAYGTASITRNKPRTGSWCAYIGSDNSGFEYTVTGLKPNTKYTFRGYVLSNPGSVNIGVREFGDAQQSATSTKTTYTQLSVAFTTGANYNSAKVCFYKSGNGAGKSYGDDFELIEN